jgi:hypothetical protein
MKVAIEIDENTRIELEDNGDASLARYLIDDRWVEDDLDSISDYEYGEVLAQAESVIRLAR